jgi:hypothetical protein
MRKAVVFPEPGGPINATYGVFEHLTSAMPAQNRFEQRGQADCAQGQSDADGSDSRDITAVPIGEEISLRRRDWVINNLRTVDRLSGAASPTSICRTQPPTATSSNASHRDALAFRSVYIQNRF